MGNKLTLGSLFSGSGGFELGGLIAGIEPIFASEVEPFPIRVTTKRLPEVKHFGDVSQLSGAELPPVDIITFGSPCQDLSIAGKRAGIQEGERSSLFFQAIRIMKEMRCKTNGKYPRYAVWENVTGAFSANKGNDFRVVLESLCRIKDKTITLPPLDGKWENAGCVLGENFSIAWRVFSAQYWGVPQRRKRIYLVADFDGRSAGKVLFESESVPGYTPQGFKLWQGAAGNYEGSVGASSLCLNDQGGERMDVTEDITATLRATSNHPALVFENHSQDTRYRGPLLEAPTVVARYGTGGNNQPIVLEVPRCFDVRFTSEGTKNVRHNCYETETSRTIDTGGNTPNCNQGGLAVVVRESADVLAPTYCTSKNSHHTQAEENLANTLMASDYKDPPIISEPSTEYIVRRLTPIECARLQGFPDWWCDNLGCENPTEEEIAFWAEVFETHRQVVTKAKKSKTRNQIIKWLRNPYSDAAAYKMWGNGVALPNVVYVLSGIRYWGEK